MATILIFNRHLIKKKMIKLLGLLSLLTLAFSCKKEMPDSPINSNENTSSNNELDCETCPSSFYTYSQTSYCDDFTSVNWATSSFIGGDTIGFTQNQTYLAQVSSGGFCELNNGNPGLFFNGPVVFHFDGAQQKVNFEIYGYYGQYAQYGFNVNGSAVNYLDQTFPLTIGGVTVGLDTSLTNIPGFKSANLTFSGAISTIEFEGFESGIAEMCVTHIGSIQNNPAFEAIAFVDFIDDSGIVTGSQHPSAKTPLGYYGLQAASMLIDFEQFLGYKPTKISFVHSHLGAGSNLLNIQLPGTPLIIAPPNALEAILSNYGYQTQVYSNTNGLMWQNEISPPVGGMQIDSIVILGENLSPFQIGANMMGSELRSICSFY